ncbi:HupE/UreJ family protein [Tropicibacter sp. Alg240-R139]|uniref:HupE/UreJ family protein n=1 Tax=Tropicibacter sp. Alg240-R139 TaxID=2305991 RepID=UPI001F073AA5|nr:HupE/UreJ family protein [Tropicibacter sp. Alg240-R139]
MNKSRRGNMRETCIGVVHKLRFLTALSTLWLWAFTATAHEVTPTIGDLSVQEGQLRLELRLNVEAFVAGIDLDGMADTDASDLSDQYDDLRKMDSVSLERRVGDFATGWAETIRAEANGPIIWAYEGIRIPVVGNAELPRASELLLIGALPERSQSVRITWPEGAGALVLRQQGVEQPYTGYLQGGETSPPIALDGGASRSAWEALAAYVPVGFDHILPRGTDHILFVLGLFFLSARLRPLLWQVTAFTLAHTVTLALGTLDVITLSPAIVEPLIALSIVFVAVENVFTRRLHRWRPMVVFGFGLLHGLGFASVLGKFGLPQDQFFAALLGFNIGVELGQLAVIAAAFLTVGLWFRNKYWYRGRIAIPASIVIALIGAYWFVERVV